MSKKITEMTAEEIWAASGDMSINEAIRSYGSPWYAAKAAVDCVSEESPIENDEDLCIHHRLTRAVEAYLLKN